jgi:hypothetical protein
LLLLLVFGCFMRCHSGLSCGWLKDPSWKSLTERRAAEAAALYTADISITRALRWKRAGHDEAQSLHRQHIWK